LKFCFVSFFFVFRHLWNFRAKKLPVVNGTNVFLDIFFQLFVFKFISSLSWFLVQLNWTAINIVILNGTNVIIFKIFSPKKLAKYWLFRLKITTSWCKSRS
jgi:hypothetical protein